MSAVACLRVLVDGSRTDVPADRLGPLVAKYSNIFLEVRWTLPRRFQSLSHFSYLLTDPTTQGLDTVELAQLSHQLQERLFGTGVEEAVKLVLFEGDADAMARFSAYSTEEVLAAMEDPSGLPAGGRLRRIAADGTRSDVPEQSRSAATAEAFQFGATIDGVQGVYFPKGGAFIGDVVNCTPVSAASYFSVLDGAGHWPDDTDSFDEACVTTALRLLTDFPIVTPLYVPVCFATFVRSSRREVWTDLAKVLPPATRGRLAVTVYDVPRAPTFQALTAIRSSLASQFCAIDLCVRDPDFEVTQLADRAVVSVTLALPDAVPDVRLQTLRRFASHSADYRRRRIAAGVTNVQSRAELDLAIDLRVPFMSGTGVAFNRDRPVGGRSCKVFDLPCLRGEQAAHLFQRRHAG